MDNTTQTSNFSDADNISKIIKTPISNKIERNWKNHDIFFNCIGTTKKKAGGPDQFYEIEYGISNEAARVASKSNIQHASLISAGGANHNLWAKKWIHPLFYIKTMGKKEQTIVSNFNIVPIEIRNFSSII